METINLDVLDTRLTAEGVEWYCEWTKGGDPKRRITVNGSTPLDMFLDTVKSRLGESKLGTLTLLAHGFGEYEYSDREKKRIKAIHGGFGMEFCKDNINLGTVDKFVKLKGLFAGSDKIGIKLLGCAAAAEYRFKVAPRTNEYKTGFGKKLCKKLAEVTNTCVMASESLQGAEIDTQERTYRWGYDIQTIKSCVKFKHWEGIVWIFHPNGKIVKWTPEAAE